MVVGVKELTVLNDRLSYSLVPLERVFEWSLVNPVILGLHCEFQRTMTLGKNT
jgi:hypothetical protein